VAKDPEAIGYGLMPADGVVPPGVRFVPIVPSGQQNPVPATRENVLLDKYPLSLTVFFLVRPNASLVVKEFVRFACAASAMPLVRESGLHHVSEKEEILAAQRLAEMRAGKGVPIRAAGTLQSLPMQDLATEYVRAKAVVQMAYFPTNEAEAVTQFVHGKELLLLNGLVPDRILKVHASAWDAMKPEFHSIAGRAVAIVTSVVNKEEAMTLDRIRSIFAGEVGQWGDNPVMAQKDIHCYGLGAADPMTALFFSGVMRGTRCKNLQVKKDTPEIVAALALDPQGIAFVDLARIPQESTAVRIVAIGPAGTAVKPNGKTMADGTYPLSKPLVLYVSPQASETAKDFVRFILSGACEPTFRQHGFVSASQPPPVQ
jgi:ABC-type phosphate transport system substrate-binding protein